MNQNPSKASSGSALSRCLFTFLLAVPLQLIGCSGDGSDSPAAPPASAPAPAPAPAPAAAVAPEVAQARLLASTLDKNPQFFPVVTQSVNEPLALLQKDQQLVQAIGPYAVPARYQATLQRLAQRAQITRVNVIVVSDLACTSVPFGGGVAADGGFVLDGKLLDVIAEVANAVALTETGRLVASTAQIVDRAAGQQLAFAKFCRFSDPVEFPDSMLTSAERDRGIEVFTQIVGGLFYHEFGHVWGWHALAGLREQILFPGGGFFSFTSALEDNADITSGILNAKAGHSATYSKLVYDLMAFTFLYRRAPGSIGYASVQTWQEQYRQLSANYSSLAVRKSLMDLGYSAWQRR